jgi:hypothetical protein
VVVVVAKHGFRLVAQAQEKLNVPGRANHGSGIELIGIGRDLFDFPYQLFSHSMLLVGGIHR